LDIYLSVFTWSLDSESTPTEREEFITQLQWAYIWTSLANENIYSDLLAITNDADEIENYVDVVVLNTWTYTSSTPTIVWCWETEHEVTKDFYDVSEVVFWQTCDNHKKVFTCNNWLWMDWISEADTETYSNELCIIMEPEDLYFSCKNILDNDSSKLNQNWVYTIDPENNLVWFEVYCDMTTDWGGWTFVVWIDWSNDNHLAIWSFNSINLNNLLWKWKYSDVIIRSLYTETYKLEVSWNKTYYKTIEFGSLKPSDTYSPSLLWNCFYSWTYTSIT
jgi:hypothetical protein